MEHVPELNIASLINTKYHTGEKYLLQTQVQTMPNGTPNVKIQRHHSLHQNQLVHFQSILFTSLATDNRTNEKVEKHDDSVCQFGGTTKHLHLSPTAANSGMLQIRQKMPLTLCIVFRW